MEEKVRITNPSMGSNDLGTERSEEVGMHVSAGTNTQLHLAALSGNKPKKGRNINDDEKVVKKTNGKSEFLEANETDE